MRPADEMKGGGATRDVDWREEEHEGTEDWGQRWWEGRRGADGGQEDERQGRGQIRGKGNRAGCISARACRKILNCCIFDISACTHWYSRQARRIFCMSKSFGICGTHCKGFLESLLSTIQALPRRAWNLSRYPVTGTWSMRSDYQHPILFPTSWCTGSSSSGFSTTWALWTRSRWTLAWGFEELVRALAAAAAALYLVEAEGEDIGQKVGVTVARRPARVVGGSRRPWPRRRLRHIEPVVVRAVPTAAASCLRTAARGVARGGHRGSQRIEDGRPSGMTVRRRRAPGEREDKAEARAIVRSTFRLRRAARIGSIVTEEAAAEIAGSAWTVPGGRIVDEAMVRCRLLEQASRPARAYSVGGNRARRSEVAWQRRMIGRMTKRNGGAREDTDGSKRRRSERLPTLQWSDSQSRCRAAGARPRAATAGRLGVVQLLAVAAAATGAAVSSGGQNACSVLHRPGRCFREHVDGAKGHWATDPANWTAVSFGSGFRYGEALHPGPLTNFDDPEAFDIDEGQELDWRALSGADGAMAAGVGQIEMLAQEQMAPVDSKHMDLMGAAIGVDMEVEECTMERAWWNIKLGERCDWEGEGIEVAPQERLLATAFPAPSGSQRGHADTGLRGDDQLAEHWSVFLGPQVEECATRPPPSSGVPLPVGLFQSLQEEDAARAGIAAERWHKLRRHQSSQRARATAGRSRRMEGDERANVSAGLRFQNVPREPNIEEVQKEPLREDEVAVAAGASGGDSARCSLQDGREPEAGKVYARRARGRRQRGNHEGEIWLLNSSGKPQLEAAVRAARETKGKCIAIMNQEHHQVPGRIADLQAAVKAQGWTAAAAAAVTRGSEGPSAGVAVLTPSHVSAGLGVGVRVDISPRGSEGRLAQLWCQRVVPSGILCISIYLHTNEGATPRNVALVSKALSTAVASGCPWVIAGDMQDSPEAFSQWAGAMLRRAGGHIISPGEPTHYPGRGEAKTLDFFIIADVVAPFIRGAKVLQQVVASPHRAVALSFRTVGPPPLHWQRRAPRPFPRVPPVGCARAPVAPRLEEVDGTEQAEVESGLMAEQAAGGVDMTNKIMEDRRSYVAQAWGKLSDAIEAEMCGRADLRDGELPDPRWCGRASGPRYVQGPALPPRAAGAWGAVDMKTHAMAWMANRVSELKNLAAIARERQHGAELAVAGTGLSVGQLKQWHRVAAKVLGCRSPMAKFLTGEQWDQARTELRRVRATPAMATDFLEGTHAWIKQMLQVQRRANADSKLKAWRSWIAKQLKDGGSAIHKFAKRMEEAPEELVFLPGAVSADPQDLVDKDFNDWGAIWRKLQRHASAPWRKEICLGASGLPRPTHGELRDAAATFPPWTGTSSELLTPRHYTWLSDMLLDRLGIFMKLLESWGWWPEQLMEALIRLIPKPTGGRRPIGLLASLVRLWERVRRPYIVEWRTKVNREYNWMTRGKGSSRAVWLTWSRPSRW